MSAFATGQMSSVEIGQTSAAETGQMPAVPESSGSAWACGVFSEALHRGFARGEESKEGGECRPSLGSLFDIMFGRG